jgi:DNA modification methylase
VATTLAQKVGRRWIGCDINQGAIQTTTKRLIDGTRE